MKGPSARQGLDKTGSMHSGHERGVVGGVHGVLDDIFVSEHFSAAHHRVFAHGIIGKSRGRKDRGGGCGKNCAFHKCISLSVLNPVSRL